MSVYELVQFRARLEPVKPAVIVALKPGANGVPLQGSFRPKPNGFRDQAGQGAAKQFLVITPRDGRDRQQVSQQADVKERIADFQGNPGGRRIKRLEKLAPERSR